MSVNFVVGISFNLFLVWLNHRMFKLKTANSGIIQDFLEFILPMNLLDKPSYVVLRGVLFGLWIFLVEITYPHLSNLVAKHFDPWANHRIDD